MDVLDWSRIARLYFRQGYGLWTQLRQISPPQEINALAAPARQGYGLFPAEIWFKAHNQQIANDKRGLWKLGTRLKRAERIPIARYQPGRHWPGTFRLERDSGRRDCASRGGRPADVLRVDAAARAVLLLCV
jgi:hypothetical protein